MAASWDDNPGTVRSGRVDLFGTTTGHLAHWFSNINGGVRGQAYGYEVTFAGAQYTITGRQALAVAARHA